MSSADFAEMIAYYQVEPFGEERSDWRAALTPYVLHLLFGKKKGRKARFKDYLFSEAIRKRPQQSIEEMKAKLKAVAALWGKRGNH